MVSIYAFQIFYCYYFRLQVTSSLCQYFVPKIKTITGKVYEEKSYKPIVYISVLCVNFENLIIRLNIFIIFKMFTKFLKNQKLNIISSNKYYNFKFL